MRLEKQLQCIQCGGSNFPLNIFGFPSFSYVHDAHPYHWSFLEGRPHCWNTYLSCSYHTRGDIPPQTTFPFVSCSLSPESEPFIIIRSFSDYSCSRPRPKTQYMIWALNPTINQVLMSHVMDLMVGIDFQPQLNQNIPLSYLCENITIDNYSHMSNKINV